MHFTSANTLMALRLCLADAVIFTENLHSLHVCRSIEGDDSRQKKFVVASYVALLVLSDQFPDTRVRLSVGESAELCDLTID